MLATPTAATSQEIGDHLHRLRELQDETGGFHAFIPLAFQPLGNTLAQNLGKTEFTTGIDDLRNHVAAEIGAIAGPDGARGVAAG